jgi:hypothetical protein
MTTIQTRQTHSAKKFCCYMVDASFNGGLLLSRSFVRKVYEGYESAQCKNHVFMILEENIDFINPRFQPGLRVTAILGRR